MKTHSHPIAPINIVLIAAVLAFWSISPLAHGDTVSYYRFGNNPDTPGSLTTATVGTNLTNNGVTAYALPETGAGSDFLNPIAGQTNTRGAQFDALGDRLTGYTGQLDLGSTFTIEAMANLTSYTTGTRMIASQWITATPNRSWYFGVGTNGELRLAVSGNGTTSTIFESGLTFDLNTDYYVAAVFDSGSVTFYMQNLTLGLELVSTNIIIGGAPASVFNSTGSYQIGNYDASTTHANSWLGVLDEVRLSNAALTSDMLLVPEPGTVALCLSAGLILMIGWWRRKATVS